MKEDNKTLIREFQKAAMNLAFAASVTIERAEAMAFAERLAKELLNRLEAVPKISDEVQKAIDAHGENGFEKVLTAGLMALGGHTYEQGYEDGTTDSGRLSKAEKK